MKYENTKIRKQFNIVKKKANYTHKRKVQKNVIFMETTTVPYGTYDNNFFLKVSLLDRNYRPTLIYNKYGPLLIVHLDL